MLPTILLPSSAVHLVEVDPALDQVGRSAGSSAPASELAAGRVLGVGVQAAEQRRQHRADGRLRRLRVGADLGGQVGHRQLGHDVVDGAHGRLLGRDGLVPATVVLGLVSGRRSGAGGHPPGVRARAGPARVTCAPTGPTRSARPVARPARRPVGSGRRGRRSALRARRRSACPAPPGTAARQRPRQRARRVPARSQRDVPVLLGRQGLALGAQQPQHPGDLGPRLVRGDDRVDVAALGGDVGVGQLVVVLGDQLGPRASASGWSASSSRR